jgi:NADH:ubiquinone oxidoreductase subunit K
VATRDVQGSASHDFQTEKGLMINHLIWAAGLIEHLILLAVLFKRRRVARFPWFTLLIIFYVVRSVGLVAALRLSGHPAPQFPSMIIDLTDVLLQCAVLAELSWNSLEPLGGIRRFTVPLLLLASGILIVLRLAPSGHWSLRTGLVLMHFLLSVLMVEWAIVLAFLLRPFRLSWRSHVATISFGFGVYSAALLAGGGYFTTGREMRDYVFFSFFRIFVYLLIVIFWSVSLWFDEPGSRA